MEKILKNRRFFYILTLICLVGFLILPNISLADDFKNIILKEIEKYLPIPEREVNALIHSLINLFNSEWIDRMASVQFTAEEMAVPNFMRETARVQALNHLLIDAPLQITWGIIKGAIEIVRIYFDPAVGLEKLKKLSVEKAIEEGKRQLFRSEVRATPGAIEFKYITRKGEIKTTIFQYIVIYKPIDTKRGELVVRFYSTEYLEPPKNRGTIGLIKGMYTELTHDLSPFIVDIQGLAENYKWVGSPKMNIDFPPEVPDLGIKPLSFWEKYVLKPIESAIKDVEIIITKVTGKSFGIVNIWEEIKKFISRIKFLAPAAVVQAPVIETGSQKPLTVKEVGGIISEIEKGLKQIEEEKEEIKVKPQPPKISEKKPKPMTLDEIQEMLDDIAERIDILTQRVAKLVAASQPTSEEIPEIEKKEEVKEKKEKIEELVEKEDTKKKGIGVCLVNINTASKEELQKITGVGPVIAQRIIEARPFSSLNDLIRVSGIGPLTLQKIINQGCAYTDLIYTGTGSGAATTPASAPVPSPQITLNYSEKNPVNKEIKVTLSVSNLKNTTYDVKISILKISEESERKRTLSEIYDGENWKDSYNYLKGVFSETSFSRDFKLKIKNENFKGEADIIAKIRQSDNKKIVLEFKGKINITDPEPEIPLLNVVINEIAWMGTAASSNHQWIELYNNTEEEINLSGWQLVWDRGEIKTSLSSIISPYGYFLMVRGCININTAPKEELQEITGVGPVIAQRIIDARPFSSVDDLVRVSGIGPAKLTGIKEQELACVEISEDNLSGVQIDFVYRGDLNENGTILELRNPQGVLVDKVDCKSAGNNDTKQTMERIDSKVSGTVPTNWANNNLITRNGLDAKGNKINGTPRAENSVSKKETIINIQNFNSLFDEFSKITLTYLGSPYIIGDNPYGNTLTVPQRKILNIEPGVILKFVAANVPGHGSRLEINGTLEAIGEENNEIIFTIYEFSFGNRWCGLNFTPTSLKSEINYALIERAGDCGTGRYFSTNYVIKVDRSKIILRNSVVENNLESRREKRGVWLKDSNSEIYRVTFLNFSGQNKSSMALHIQRGNPIIKNSIFRKNDVGIRIVDDKLLAMTSFPVIEENYFEENHYPIFATIYGSAPIFKSNKSENKSNTYNGILLEGSILQNSTLYKNDLPYMIGTPSRGWMIRVEEGITLTIKPGVRVEFGDGGGFEIWGTLLAGSNEGETVIFTTALPGQSIWRDFYFSPSSVNSILENVNISYGGIGNVPPGITQIYVDKSLIQFRNLTSTNSISAGIYLKNSPSIIQNSHFGNNKMGIIVEGTEKLPQLINNTFKDNADCDIYYLTYGRCEK